MTKKRSVVNNLYSQEIPSFSGGVSQQPDSLRFPNQLQEQINGYSGVVDGLEKRPPLLHIAKLRETVKKGQDKFHFINRDKDEKYVVRISNDEIEVWDLKGNRKEVRYPQGKGYLNTNGSKPIDTFKCLTVADHTFILNTGKTVKMRPELTPNPRKDVVLLYFKNVRYGKLYSVYDHQKPIAAVLAPDGSRPEDSTSLTTDVISSWMVNMLNGSMSPDFTDYNDIKYKKGADKIYTFRDPNYDTSKIRWWMVGQGVIFNEIIDKSYKAEYQLFDGFGGQDFLIVEGSVPSTTKLPPVACADYIVNVKGVSKGNSDDYWLKQNMGVWRECAKPDIKYKIDSDTMPWVLVREADGHFEFKKVDWLDRQTGDDLTNPEPSFIDHTINDIFFYRNRLGLISGEAVSLSAVSDFYNFWYNSAVTITDTDTIDVSVSSNKVVNLTHAVPFARELMLFSREGQFVLGSDGVMTPKSVKVDQLTAFDYSDTCAPVVVGQNIYFVNERVDYCSIMRYFTVQDVAELKNAEDTTAHVPSYIPRGIRHLAGSPTYDLLLGVSESHPEEVYAYKFIFNNGQPIQQSWSKWRFNNDIEVVMVEYIDKYIYFLTNNSKGLYLDRMSLTGTAKDFEDEPYRLYMDYKIRYVVPKEAYYDDYNGWTKLSFKDIYGSYPAHLKPFYVVETDGTVTTVQPEDILDDGSFIIKRDLRGETIFIGRGYAFYATLSRIDIKNSDGGVVSSETEGRLQVRYFWFNYAKSGAMSVYVNDPRRKQQYRYINTDKDLGVNTCKLDTKVIKDGRFKFPVQRQNKDVIITVESRYPTPLNITSGGWEGYYVRRNTRI